MSDYDTAAGAADADNTEGDDEAPTVEPGEPRTVDPTEPPDGTNVGG